MASLLAKFRIDYSDVIVIPDVTKKAGDDIKTEFKTLTDKINVDEAELLANKEKTNRNLKAWGPSTPGPQPPLWKIA